MSKSNSNLAKQALKFSPRKSATKTAETQRIDYFQLLNSNGKLVSEAPPWAIEKSLLVSLYRIMLKTRLFDTKAVTLQRQGKLGTYASCLGQEAIGTAIGWCMQANDVLFPAYREYAAQFLRGVTMTEILLYWGGNEQGMNYRNQPRDFPICVPIASQAPHAVGCAYAMKLRREANVAVCVVGDGATSKGDFYEALNAAGAWDLPIVFVVNNNQWAISLPRTIQSKAPTLAHKSLAAGVHGEQVDGNDIIALLYRLNCALDQARHGNGPCLIEALSYRLCDHTTADNADRYRNPSEVKKQWRNEPLIRLKKYMDSLGFWSESDDQSLREQLQQEIEEASQDYLKTPTQPVSSLFDYLYEDLPAAFAEQRQQLIRKGGRHDGT